MDLFARELALTLRKRKRKRWRGRIILLAVLPKGPADTPALAAAPAHA